MGRFILKRLKLYDMLDSKLQLLKAKLGIAMGAWLDESAGLDEWDALMAQSDMSEYYRNEDMMK